jgi:hypothetical protein
MQIQLGAPISFQLRNAGARRSRKRNRRITLTEMLKEAIIRCWGMISQEGINKEIDKLPDIIHKVYNKTDGQMSHN